MTTETGPVLVATDLHDGGDEALRQADAWARRTSAALVVCHAIPDPIRLEPLFPQLGVEASQLVLETQKRVSGAIGQRVADLTGRSSSDVEVIVEPGIAHSIVVEAARRVGASLVVVGATSRGRVTRWLLGSTAEAVVRQAPCPVLVARPSPASGVVLAATDLSEAALPGLAAAIAEARRRGARVRAVHCLDVAHPALSAFEPYVLVDDTTLASLHDSARRVLETSLERVGGGSEDDAAVIDGSPTRALGEAAHDSDAELLVIATHGRTGLARLALGSVAGQVVRNAPCSVLVVPSKPR